MSDQPAICLFCEKQPVVHRFGLCEKCSRTRGIRRLYLRRRNWTPEWEKHLLKLTDRAKRRKPLFD